MIYQNSRPVVRNNRRKSASRRFEWQDFPSDSQASEALIKERFEFDRDETRLDRFFLLPERRDQIIKMNDNEVFQIDTLVDAEGPLEVWETTVESKIPMRQTLAKTIASRIPKFSGAVAGSFTAEELSENLSRKSRFFKVKVKREIYKRGDVTAKISRTKVNDLETVSISFESPEAEPLLTELQAMGMKRRENTNVGTFLLNQNWSE